MGALLSQPFILASASPRRIDMLRGMGLHFEIVPSDIDESPTPHESPQHHVLRLSREKAQKVGKAHPRGWVLGADTIVVIAEEILGKPADRSEAEQMLRKLSGRAHEVYTGFTLFHGRSEKVSSRTVKSAVFFRNIPDDEIAWYLSTPEPYDKAGAYAVQGMGAFFIKEIQGSYTNVMGLPLCEVVDALKEENILTFC